MRLGLLAGVGLLTMLPALAAAEPGALAGAPKPLNTLGDVHKALRACWRWPPAGEVRSGMAFTVRLSFRRNGEIFGARITYQTPNVSEPERALYYGALLAALSRCTPLPFTESLGEAIAGRPMHFHIHDTRQQRKA